MWRLTYSHPASRLSWPLTVKILVWAIAFTLVVLGLAHAADASPLVVRDSKGKLVGRVLATNELALDFVTPMHIVRPVAGVLADLMIDRAGILASPAPVLVYLQPQCGGPPYLLLDPTDLLATVAVTSHAAGDRIYVGDPKAARSGAIASGALAEPQQCSGDGFSQTPEGWCCFTPLDGTTGDDPVAPATLVFVSTLGLTPPFRLE